VDGELPVTDVFTCPRCGRTSYNPNDKREGYCGACHDWTGTDEEPIRVMDGNRAVAFPKNGITMLALARCWNCTQQIIGVGEGHWVHAEDGMEPCREQNS
jgi:ribosomal protein S27AE